jgi:CRP/FNR family transcriptional regulator, polysaccharide utilization system transcription regulator
MNQQPVTRETSAFAADPEVIKTLEERARPVEFFRDLVLFRQGDPPVGVFVIKDGYAVLTMRSGARIVMLAVTGRGSILGLPAAIGNSAYSLTADVVQNSRVDCVSREDLLDLMRTDPGLSWRLLQILSTEVRAAREALSAML